jgi:glucuronosyltransferase
MQQLSRIFRDRPVSVQQSVVFWTEYVIRYAGAKHLRTVAADMPLYQYLLLDIICVAVFTILASWWTVRFLVRKALRKDTIKAANKEKFS